MAAETPVLYNVETWVEENQKYFLPPVCNKMMHNTQLKVRSKFQCDLSGGVSVDVSQQGVDFSKKISKLKIFFDLTFTDVHTDHQKLGTI